MFVRMVPYVIKADKEMGVILLWQCYFGEWFPRDLQIECVQNRNNDNTMTMVNNSFHRRLFCVTTLLLALIATTLWGQSEEVEEFDDSGMGELQYNDSGMWSERSIVIVGTTTDYSAAVEIASDASYYLDLMLDLRELNPDSTIGLSWSPEICEGAGWEHPCYVARGRFDNGVYLSIEHSDAYQGFSPGYYIVVMASGEPDSPMIRESLTKAKTFVEDAYLKKTKVYMGCMH